MSVEASANNFFFCILNAVVRLKGAWKNARVGKVFCGKKRMLCTIVCVFFCEMLMVSATLGFDARIGDEAAGFFK